MAASGRYRRLLPRDSGSKLGALSRRGRSSRWRPPRCQGGPAVVCGHRVHRPVSGHKLHRWRGQFRLRCHWPALPEHRQVKQRSLLSQRRAAHGRALPERHRRAQPQPDLGRGLSGHLRADSGGLLRRLRMDGRCPAEREQGHRRSALHHMEREEGRPLAHGGHGDALLRMHRRGRRAPRIYAGLPQRKVLRGLPLPLPRCPPRRPGRRGLRGVPRLCDQLSGPAVH
mmetsp:Transcript_15596/g.49062  ORF Transcript_15596/g.49062 Transcript_15596/m.49062 type:complete len:227 (-) Transcript_15596:291-971(-)